MKHDEKKNIDKSSDVTNNENMVSKDNLFSTFLNFIFKKRPWVGSIAVFIITIIVNAVSATSSGYISFLRLLIITFFVTLTVFICLSPVLIMHLIKSLRCFVIDEKIEENNLNLSKKLCELAVSLQESTERFDESISRNENYFKVPLNHMDDCRKINNIVKKSYMIKDVDEYYQHLTRARENADGKDVFLTNFSTKPYVIGNKYRDEYYSTNTKFIRRTRCNVYRIVTVHSKEKLLFLKDLFDDAEESGSIKYHLAYLDIDKFSDETIDILPGIVGMDIIENEVIIMDYRFARALRRNDNFNSPLYMESEKIADMCRAYYNKIWEDISDETPISKRRYQGYVLYNGTTRKVHDDMDNIWKKIESNISIKK